MSHDGREAAGRAAGRRAAGLEHRLRTADLRNVPIVGVLVIAATGIGYAAAVPPHWLRGVLVLAVAMVLGGVLRVLLPTRQAGLLAVRSRAVDAMCYIGAGAALVVLGLALPR